MKFDYKDEIVDSIVLIDYDLCELRIIKGYFDELLSGKTYKCSASFFEKAVEEHGKFRNRMDYTLDTIRVKLELNKNVELKDKLKELFKERNYISDDFVIYNEDSDRTCLKNYSNMCNRYMDQLKKEREFLKTLAM